MSDVLMTASIRDKKRIEHDMLPQTSETPVKEVRNLDARGFHGNVGRALERQDKQNKLKGSEQSEISRQTI
jgi:hypothetical protein